MSHFAEIIGSEAFAWGILVGVGAGVVTDFLIALGSDSK